jgi:hypothetical protein
MTLNLSSRRCELIIGSQNWTNWISFDSGIILGYPEYEVGTGLMPVTGSINLKISRYDSTVPSSPNPRLNPSQWKRGQLVTIRIANTSGTLTYLPCSGQALHLLKMPQKPKRNMDGILELSLEIGCRLALENFPPEPNQDISGITAGTPLARNTVITNILNYIDVANSIDSIPYPIAYPLPKQTGNFIGFAGAIADSGGYYLRCNSAGTVIAEPISTIYSGSAIASYIIGSDEKSWDAIGDIAEQPIEKLIVTGTVKEIIPVDTAPSEVIDTQPAGVLFKGTALGTQNPTALFTAKRTITTSEISSTFLKKTIETREPAGVIFKGTALGDQNPTVLFISDKSINTYTLVNGIVTAQTVTSFQPAGVIIKGTTFGDQNPSVLITAKREDYEWVNTGSQKWIKTYTRHEPAGVLFKGTALGDQNPTVLFTAANFSDDKDTSGPPTNFGDASTNTTEEVQLKAEIFAQQLAADPYRPRQRTIDVPYTVDQSQLVDYGSRFNRILSGRAYGQQFGGAITDTALSSAFKPFADVAVTDADLIYYLKLDCIKWGLNGTEAWLVFNGIEVGTAPASTPTVISRPVAITLGNFNMIGLADLRINFNPIAPSTMIGLADLYINYNPIKPNTMIGLATL